MNEDKFKELVGNKYLAYQKGYDSKPVCYQVDRCFCRNKAFKSYTLVLNNKTFGFNETELRRLLSGSILVKGKGEIFMLSDEPVSIVSLTEDAINNIFE